jgi:hypothetical protein
MIFFSYTPLIMLNAAEQEQAVELVMSPGIGAAHPHGFGMLPFAYPPSLRQHFPSALLRAGSAQYRSQGRLYPQDGGSGRATSFSMAIKEGLCVSYPKQAFQVGV